MTFFASGLKNRIIQLLIVIALIFALVRIYYALTDDFRLGNITYEIPYDKNWEIASLTPKEEHELDKALNQSYTYLGKGSQCYAFVSKDDQYVVKFFKFKHLRPSWFVNSLPSIGPIKKYQEKQAARKERKLYGVYNSYKLAYDVDRQESGVLFIQLNYSGNPQRQVVLFDKLGLKHVIDLDHIAFIVQKKGEVFRDVLGESLKKGDIGSAKMRIGQVFEMYSGEYRKGVFDHDHGVMRNIGFVGDQPIHLDVGKLMADESMKDLLQAKKDLNVVANAIKHWVRSRYPQFHSELSSYMDGKIDELFD